MHASNTRLVLILQCTPGGRVLPKNWGGEGAARHWKPLLLISDKNKCDFPNPIFRPDPKFHTLFQTKPLPHFICLNILILQNQNLLLPVPLNKMTSLLNVWLQQKSIPTPWKVIGNSLGGGGGS